MIVERLWGELINVRIEVSQMNVCKILSVCGGGISAFEMNVSVRLQSRQKRSR